MNTAPIDTAGLTEALERSVSSMAAAGNTLDESIGLITAANSVVQDPATVGKMYAHVKSTQIGETPEMGNTEGKALKRESRNDHSAIGNYTRMLTLLFCSEGMIWTADII